MIQSHVYISSPKEVVETMSIQGKQQSRQLSINAQAIESRVYENTACSDKCGKIVHL